MGYMKIVIAVVFVLSVAGQGRGIKCHQCSNCTERDLPDATECQGFGGLGIQLFNACEKKTAAGIVSRSCSLDVGQGNVRCHFTAEISDLRNGTEVCTCKTDACNGTNTMHSPITYIPLIVIALIINIFTAYK